MRLFLLVVLAAWVAGAAGCGPSVSGNSATTNVAGESAASQAEPVGPLVPYPQFENWSRFTVGTKVVRRKEVTNEFGTVIETESLRLVEKTDAKVVVESQTLVERSNGSRDDNPPQVFEFPATFRLPASFTIEQFSLPSLKAKLVGTEKASVSDKEYEAQVYEWTEVNEAGPMTVRLLTCDAFPGGKIRQEMFAQQTGTRSVEQIAEVAFPES